MDSNTYRLEKAIEDLETAHKDGDPFVSFGSNKYPILLEWLKELLYCRKLMSRMEDDGK